ncbi:MAG: hypothetical protein RIR76_3022 [Verrucomicrobiota bacterium]|jgi:hypothetical protein|nr:hypothetical protein [Opitutaceae bacterium]
MRTRLPTPASRRFLVLLFTLVLVPAGLLGAETAPVRVLFLGNSFLFGSGSPVRFFRPGTVNDLNQAGVGGVPALFKAFTRDAGLAYDVGVETASGQGFDYHLEKKAAVIARPWDIVVMQSHSVLNQAKPGDPDLLIRSSKALGELFARHNPRVDVRLIATWPRADLVYPEKGAWHGKGLEGMARDVRAAYDRAAAATPQVRGVIPVGESWLRAMRAGFADENPYDGIAFGQVSLWTHDHYHASTTGYYLEALMVFGHVTNRDPRSLGGDETAAFELGMSKEQAEALQRIAAEELSAAGVRLEPFKTTAPPLVRRIE